MTKRLIVRLKLIISVAFYNVGKIRDSILTMIHFGSFAEKQ